MVAARFDCPQDLPGGTIDAQQPTFHAIGNVVRLSAQPQIVVLSDLERERLPQVRPLAEILSLQGESLNPAIFTIRDVQKSL